MDLTLTIFIATSATFLPLHILACHFPLIWSSSTSNSKDLCTFFTPVIHPLSDFGQKNNSMGPYFSPSASSPSSSPVDSTVSEISWSESFEGGG